MKDRIDIKSIRTRDFSTKVVISDQHFLVETELHGRTKPAITSRVYRGGEIVSTYRQELDNYTDKAAIQELLVEHHQLSIEAMKEELQSPEMIPTHYSLDDAVGEVEEALTLETTPSNLLPEEFMDVVEEALETTHTDNLQEDAVDNVEEVQEPEKPPSDYLRETKVPLARKNYSSAMGLVCEGLEHHPEDPSLLSLHGYLTAKVRKDYERGIDDCKKAIEFVGRMVPSDPEFLYPEFFLNLGRAYAEAGDRRHAVDTFMRVLFVDENNSLIRMEMRKLGVRRRPLLAFLGRSHPLNKYAGLFLCRFLCRTRRSLMEVG